jgi:hypothetical protein
MAAGGVSALRMTFFIFQIYQRAIMSHHAHEPFTIAFLLRTHKGAGTGVDISLLQAHRPRNDEHLVANLRTQLMNPPLPLLGPAYVARYCDLIGRRRAMPVLTPVNHTPVGPRPQGRQGRGRRANTQAPTFSKLFQCSRSTPLRMTWTSAFSSSHRPSSSCGVAETASGPHDSR